MLYSSVGPVGAVITMVPVAMLHEGWGVTDAVGASGKGFTVTVTSFVIGQLPDVLLVTV